MSGSLGDRLKELRAMMGITQEDVSEVVRVSVQAVSSWETGIRTPPVDMLQRLADFYGVSVDWLLGRTSIRPNPLLMAESETIRILFRATRGLSPEATRDVLDYIHFKRAREKAESGGPKPDHDRPQEPRDTFGATL